MEKKQETNKDGEIFHFIPFQKINLNKKDLVYILVNKANLKYRPAAIAFPVVFPQNTVGY